MQAFTLVQPRDMRAAIAAGSAAPAKYVAGGTDLLQDLDGGGTIRSVRVASGGVGTKPWRLGEVEAALTGKPAVAATFKAAADQASAGAKPAAMNGFKLVLLRSTVLRAPQTVSA